MHCLLPIVVAVWPEAAHLILLLVLCVVLSVGLPVIYIFVALRLIFT